MRALVFCLFLMLLWIPAVSLLIEFLDIYQYADKNPGGFIAINIAKSAPIIAKDASSFGEFTPMALAGALTFLAPKKKNSIWIYISIIICIIGWGLYMILSSQIEPGSNFFNALETTLEGNVNNGISVLQNFSTGARVFYLVVAASLLGIKLRSEETE